MDQLTQRRDQSCDRARDAPGEIRPPFKTLNVPPAFSTSQKANKHMKTELSPRAFVTLHTMALEIAIALSVGATAVVADPMQLQPSPPIAGQPLHIMVTGATN